MSESGTIPEQQVLAVIGDMVTNIPQWEETVAARQPEIIVFAYGMNDLGHDLGGELNYTGYAALYEEAVEQIEQVSPESTIALNSIIHCASSRMSETANWEHVDEFNEEIAAVCQKHGWIYIDNTEICQGGYADIYVDDGIHFQTYFYPIWLDNMAYAFIDAEEY